MHCLDNEVNNFIEREFQRVLEQKNTVGQAWGSSTSKPKHGNIFAICDKLFSFLGVYYKKQDDSTNIYLPQKIIIKKRALQLKLANTLLIVDC